MQNIKYQLWHVSAIMINSVEIFRANIKISDCLFYHTQTHVYRIVASTEPAVLNIGLNNIAASVNVDMKDNTVTWVILMYHSFMCFLYN